MKRTLAIDKKKFQVENVHAILGGVVGSRVNSRDEPANSCNDHNDAVIIYSPTDYSHKY